MLGERLCSSNTVDMLIGRPSNYGSRIDLILCTPGLRPWIKGGDIQANVFGSDHCPVHIDLHEEITLHDGTVLKLRDQLNPADRPPSTAPVYPNAIPREAPEPPRFATKFLDEYSGKQTTLRGFFPKGKAKSLVEPSPSPTPDEPITTSAISVSQTPPPPHRPIIARTPTPDDPLAAPFSIARAAFDTIGLPTPTSQSTSRTTTIDLTQDEVPSQSTARSISPLNSTKTAKAKIKPAKSANGQQKIQSFFAKPTVTERRESPPTKRKKSPPRSTPPSTPPQLKPTSANTAEEDALVAQAIAEADAEKASKRAKTNAEAAPVWSNLFAKKIPPLCTVHQKPCKDFSQSSLIW